MPVRSSPRARRTRHPAGGAAGLRHVHGGPRPDAGRPVAHLAYLHGDLADDVLRGHLVENARRPAARSRPCSRRPSPPGNSAPAWTCRRLPGRGVVTWTLRPGDLQVKRGADWSPDVDRSDLLQVPPSHRTPTNRGHPPAPASRTNARIRPQLVRGTHRPPTEVAAGRPGSAPTYHAAPRCPTPVAVARSRSGKGPAPQLVSPTATPLGIAVARIRNRDGLSARRRTWRFGHVRSPPRRRRTTAA